MTHYDVFNGDADGLCALHQLRLADPVDAVLVPDKTAGLRELGICLNYNAMTCIKLPWSGGVIRSGDADFSFPAAS